MGDVCILPVVKFVRQEPKPQWRWFALTIAPGREFAAERILRADGFDVFVPLKHIVVRTRDRTRKNVVARPLLNGYVFIGFDRFDVPWLDVMRFRMIIGVIAHAGEPYPFSEPDMRRLAIGSSRPTRYINAAIGKKKRKRPNAQITSGPYEGKRIRLVEFHNSEAEIYELFEPYLARSHAL